MLRNDYLRRLECAGHRGRKLLLRLGETPGQGRFRVLQLLLLREILPPLALLGVRRHDTLIGVFFSLHGSEIISVCSQPSLAKRHQLAFRRRLADVRLVDLLGELHRD